MGVVTKLLRFVRDAWFKIFAARTSKSCCSVHSMQIKRHYENSSSGNRFDAIGSNEIWRTFSHWLAALWIINSELSANFSHLWSTQLYKLLSSFASKFVVKFMQFEQQVCQNVVTINQYTIRCNNQRMRCSWTLTTHTDELYSLINVWFYFNWRFEVNFDWLFWDTRSASINRQEY